MATNPFTVVGGEGRKRGPGRPPLGNHRDPVTITDYDPRAFYTRASDEKGHRVLVHVHYPQDWSWMVAKVVYSIPGYDSPADLMRDALFHRLKFLLEHVVTDADAANELERQAAYQASLHHRAQYDTWAAELKATEKTIREYTMAGYHDGLTAEMQNLRDWATRVPEPFKSRALTLVALTQPLHQHPTEPES